MNSAPSRRWRPLDLVNVTASYLDGQGIENARLNAEMLLAHALRWDRLHLYTRFETILSDTQIDAYREFVRRRAGREPLQHILTRAEFRSLDFCCDARVLTPRPETEHVVAETLRRAQGLTDPLIADVGTGSGCIAVSLACALPGASLVATDVSAEALDVALKNIETHGVAGRVHVLLGDLAEPLLAGGYAGRIDLIACNPPYVASHEFGTLQPEVRDYEPRVALDGGADGLDFYRRFFGEARPLLKPGGSAILELPEAGADTVRSVAEDSGWVNVAFLADHVGIRRVMAAELGRVR